MPKKYKENFNVLSEGPLPAVTVQDIINCNLSYSASDYMSGYKKL